MDIQLFLWDGLMPLPIFSEAFYAFSSFPDFIYDLFLIFFGILKLTTSLNNLAFTTALDKKLRPPL